MGVASAYCVVLQSPAAAPQVLAKVHGELFVFLIVINLGTFLTCVRRTIRLARRLEET